MGGSLDQPQSSKVVRHSKIIDINDMTRPQVKVALDEYLEKGWYLASIYVEAGVARAVMIRTEDE